ncbi:class I SAM-dependent methyltransferase [Burkholderia cepacia]|uniref:class I SAM-dependent methyltransferase n=1 Tax=Burkholderia cepacia TaxID=292 RepID=UPI001E3F2817|nr:SAM-dependent methyltransferase [Burkholderia cepacia]MDN7857642.1 SAM-dependent methyltransferase [Burkholderia cepacia]UIY62677.1 SAM-dependent methyltransferase [Burkholderia cepacia]
MENHATPTLILLRIRNLSVSTFDIPVGVGQTALFIAWQRHAESLRPDALFHDPFAAALIEQLAGTPTHEHVSEVARRANFPQYFVVRTRYFDDAIRANLSRGIQQVVTLAAGMDGRVARLACPSGTRWFELDLDDIITFKRELMKQAGLPLQCDWRPLVADLTSDWASPLRAAGFDPAKPTIWLIEGLLMYLRDTDCDALIRQVADLSAPGSALMLEHLAARMMSDEGKEARARVESQGARWLSSRDDVRDWLGRYGWTATVHASDDPTIAYGRSVARIPAGWFASSTRTAPGGSGS